MKLLLIPSALLLILFTCDSCTYDHVSEDYLGEYSITYSYTYTYFVGNGYASAEYTKNDQSCFLTKNADGEVYLEDFEFFDDYSALAVITDDSIKVPSVTYGSYAEPITFSGHGPFTNDGFTMSITHVHHNWDGSTNSSHGTATATKK